eukprot:g1816.t1
MYVDGECVADFSAEKFDHESSIALKGGYVVTLKVETEGMIMMSYKYSLRVDGVFVPPFEDIKDTPHVAKLDLRIRSLENTENPSPTFVVEAAIIGTSDGNSVKKDGEGDDRSNNLCAKSYRTDHKFEDFVELHANLLSTYVGLTTSRALERLNVAAECLHQKRKEKDSDIQITRLNTFLDRVSSMPGVRFVPDVLNFFNLPFPKSLPTYVSTSHVALDFSAVSPAAAKDEEGAI